MAKFHGVIGYAFEEETAPGVWEDVQVEKEYRGDVILNQFRWQSSEQLNENLNIDNSISIIADEFAYLRFGYMKYVTWHGEKWKIQSISVNRPRIVIQIGGLYNA